jgi:outer membrane immunogenic protein
MKKLALAISVLAISGASALAADMAPAPIYTKAPIVPPVVYDWTGFYVGGNIGYSWASWDSTSLAFPTFPGTPNFFSDTAKPHLDGVVGGVQGGYNWQFSPKWVVGIEGDFDWTGERASDPAYASLSFPSGIGTGICDAHPICTTTITGATTNDWKLPWFATLRGRLGYNPDPTWLIYGTGGLAVGEMGFSTSASATTTITNSIGQTFPGFPISASSGVFSQNETRVGYAVGGGIEKMFSPNWTVKLEYLYLDWGTYTFLSGTGYDTSVRLRDNIVRAGVNYKFGGPVVAKY